VDPDPEIPLFIMSNLTHLLYKAEDKGKIYGMSRILEQIYEGSETGTGSETMLNSRILIRKKSFPIHYTDCHRNHQPYRSAVMVGGSGPRRAKMQYHSILSEIILIYLLYTKGLDIFHLAY
jgi:hypothetical protein